MDNRFYRDFALAGLGFVLAVVINIGLQISSRSIAPNILLKQEENVNNLHAEALEERNSVWNCLL